jgi:hypothetical protein
MDINNINGKLNGHLNGTRSSEETGKPQADIKPASKNGYSDKVSLGRYSGKKNEELFARVELEKLNQSSFDKLRTMKAKIAEYEEAKKSSPESAAETEIGKMLNNPGVWKEIADKISR